ncbi:MAG: YkgJ family cysteine cluster protein [Desulfobacteraceae bacterium]|nr:YkgJ family cysteine cluster protein [Desulfobacteraceae bacterium]
MNEDHQFTPIATDATFQFHCHRSLACFNSCCRDLNQALTPYDILRLRAHLKLLTTEFLKQYVTIYIGPETNLPIASFRFHDQRNRNCPFVTPEGCSVYPARPASCRIYPLARALVRSSSGGLPQAHYAIMREPHCTGFGEKKSQTVNQWVRGQGLQAYHEMNDEIIEFISLKNRLIPGPLSNGQLQLIRLAFYDLDKLKQLAVCADLNPMTDSLNKLMPHSTDHDPVWLQWSLKWIRFAIFGENASHPNSRK